MRPSSNKANAPLAARLAFLANELNEHGKEQVLTATATVMTADGVIDDRDRAAVQSIGASLGMSPAHVRGVIDTATAISESRSASAPSGRSVDVADSWGWPSLVDFDGRTTVAEVVVVCRRLRGADVDVDVISVVAAVVAAIDGSLSSGFQVTLAARLLWVARLPR